MDTHDTPLIDVTTPFAANMVITIEPGLYIDDADDVPTRFRNIGIRVEDNIVLQSNGAPPLVLTRALGKSTQFIERLRASSLAPRAALPMSLSTSCVFN